MNATEKPRVRLIIDYREINRQKTAIWYVAVKVTHYALLSSTRAVTMPAGDYEKLRQVWNHLLAETYWYLLTKGLISKALPPEGAEIVYLVPERRWRRRLGVH